jgi:hypothetical protein
MTKGWLALGLLVGAACGVVAFAAPAGSVRFTWTPDPVRQEMRINGVPVHVASQPLIVTVAEGQTPPTVEVRSCVAQTEACGPWRTVMSWK